MHRFARQAIKHAEGRKRADLESDDLLLFALAHMIQDIGEAARRVPDDFRAKHRHIPWRGIAGMRNFIVHEYWRVDPDHLACRQGAVA